MRVVTWNMAYWSHRSQHDAAWRWVLEELRPDILLCQEAVPPDWVKEKLNVVWSPAYPGGSQPWGTGLVTSLPCERVRLADLDDWFSRIPEMIPEKNERAGIHRADGWLATASIRVPTVGDALFASVHSPAYPIEASRLSGVDISAMKLKKNPNLWFLDVLFFFLKSRIGSGFCVGGDFNYSRLLDVTTRDAGNNEFFDRVAQEGFVSLHRLFHEADERTFFHERRAHHQLDYLYADSRVSGHVRGCVVHPKKPFSDHAPMVADFSLNDA